MENKNAYGCLPGKFDIRDYKLNKKKVAMAVNLPKEYICCGLPEVKNQGSVGSCVAHAASEILEYHNECRHKMSTNFIYGVHKYLYNSDGPGMFLREACKIMLDYGDPEATYCPGNTEVEGVYKIAEAAFKDIDTRNNACKYRIKGYARLFTESDIKYALLNYGPVLAAIKWYDNNTVENGILIEGDGSYGGHAIMIYGWNEIGFVCQNSWGKGWGEKGRFILPYDYTVRESYSILPRDASEEDDDIIIPTRNKILDVIYKIINSIINLFK